MNQDRLPGSLKLLHVGHDIHPTSWRLPVVTLWWPASGQANGRAGCRHESQQVQPKLRPVTASQSVTASCDKRGKSVPATMYGLLRRVPYCRRGAWKYLKLHIVDGSFQGSYEQLSCISQPEILQHASNYRHGTTRSQRGTILVEMRLPRKLELAVTPDLSTTVSH